MNTNNTVPAGLDYSTTMPGLLTQPAVLRSEPQQDRGKLLYKLIFTLAVLAFAALLVLR